MLENIIHFVSEKHMLFIIGILVFFGLIETILGFWTNSKRSKNDMMVEIVSTFFLMAITKPTIVFLTFKALQFGFSSSEVTLSAFPFWANLLIFLLVDDFLQYWYHRFAHENKTFWKWHRGHHTATEMGLLVSYRQAIYYYMLMPNIYWLGIFTFLGGGIAVGVGVVLKQIVIISSHSLATWDSFFHRNKLFTPILKVVERIFITPAFHHAHHGVSKIDGVSNPNGNYGNMFSIWDQLFGTAHFAHDFPSEYGIPNNPNDSWASQSFYPLVKSEKSGSELAENYVFEKTTTNEPAVMTLSQGAYLYCTCGFSKNQPFCDGSHHGTKHQPIRFEIKKEMEYKLCNCKMCEKGPFCDNSHLKMDFPTSQSNSHSTNNSISN